MALSHEHRSKNIILLIQVILTIATKIGQVDFKWTIVMLV